MALRACIIAAATLISLAAVQMSRDPSVVYHAVGTSLRWSTLDAATGSLTSAGAPAVVPADIQYAAVHPTRKAIYVSVSGRGQPNSIHAFAIEPKTGALSVLGAPLTLPDTLGRAVHLTVDSAGRFLLTAHNATETIAVVRLQEDGRLGQIVPQGEIPKLGYLVHQIRIDPSSRWVFVPVRGNNAAGSTPERPGRLHVFAFDNGVLRPHRTAEYASGDGPRHLDFHPTGPWLYVLTERGNQLITYQHTTGELKELFRVTTLRNPAFTFPTQRAGAIHVHPNGRWVYVTNRNVAPCAASVPCPEGQTPLERGENTIGAFSIDAASGRPTLQQHIDSHGFEPRTFTIAPGGAHLVAGNMANILWREAGGLVEVQPNLALFRIEADGRLTFLRAYDQPDAGSLWWVGN
jgi:6-phosphogluconolactonase (cycloisomerase 2 family)